MIERCICAPAQLLLCGALVACGGGGSSGIENPVGVSSQAACDGDCVIDEKRLTILDVERILAQGIDQAQALGVDATLAVVDRVGNVLAVHRMAEISAAVTIGAGVSPATRTGLEGLVLPEGLNGDGLAAIAKAVTGAYLSSGGNAFSTRTANQIVQEHFNPGERLQPGGPLFGVQFSQLACSDFTLPGSGLGGSVGPQRSPLGLAADPGGFPLYKYGQPVGGVGAIADGRYSIDANILDRDRDTDEQIALAASWQFQAPQDLQADRVTVDGKTLRFSDVDFDDLAVAPEQAPDYRTLVGRGDLAVVRGYTDGTIVPGTVFGEPGSGIRRAVGFGSLDAFVFVDSGNSERFAPRAGTDDASLSVPPLSAAEVRQLLVSALRVADRSRAQIRLPLGSSARVTVSVVDSRGTILGILRSRDAPVFGADVSLQKARTAALFSSADAADFFRGISKPAIYLDNELNPGSSVEIGTYVSAIQALIGAEALRDGIAFSDRAGGNLSRPFFPDGINGNPHGPFSKSLLEGEWSVFSTGLQLDLVINQLLAHVFFALGVADEDVGPNCTDAATPRVAGGIQIFPGSVPIYRNGELIGGIGVSGDGVDQDDMIAFLGVHEAGEQLASGVGNAPPAIRADQLQPGGERLRFVQCPPTPYLSSDAQNVCAGK